MKTSEHIDKLAAALCEFQGEVKNPARNRTVKVNSDKGSYTFDYATLDAILAENRPLLKKHGLSIAQGMESDSQLSTRLIHSSGQWIEVMTPVVIGQGRGPQALGSAITYARRYAIAPLLAIAADEDDDGNGAEGNPHAGAPRAATAPQAGKLTTSSRVADMSIAIREASNKEAVDNLMAGIENWTDEDYNAVAAVAEARVKALSSFAAPIASSKLNPPVWYLGADGKPICQLHKTMLKFHATGKYGPWWSCKEKVDGDWCKAKANNEEVEQATR